MTARDSSSGPVPHIASSNMEGLDYPLENVLDGRLDTWFQTDHTVRPGSCIAIDIQAVEYVTKLALTFGNDLGQHPAPHSRLEVSVDGIEWTPVEGGEVYMDSLEFSLTIPPGKEPRARYVRLLFTTAESSDLVAVRSFIVSHEQIRAREISVSSALSQDFDLPSVPVRVVDVQPDDSRGLRYRVAAFVNRSEHEDIRLTDDAFHCDFLAIAPGQGGGDTWRVLHASPAPGTPTGWNVTGVFSDLARGETIYDVAAFTSPPAGAGMVHGYLLTSEGIYHSQLREGQSPSYWTQPTVISTEVSEAMRLRTTYSGSGTTQAEPLMYTWIENSAGSKIQLVYPDEDHPYDVTLPGAGLRISKSDDFTVTAVNKNTVMVFAGEEVELVGGEKLLNVSAFEILVDHTAGTAIARLLRTRVFLADRVHCAFSPNADSSVIVYTNRAGFLESVDFHRNQGLIATQLFSAQRDVYEAVYQQVQEGAEGTYSLYTRDRTGTLRVARGQFNSDAGKMSWMPTVTLGYSTYALAVPPQEVGTSSLYTVSAKDIARPELLWRTQDTTNRQWHVDRPRMVSPSGSAEAEIVSRYLVEATVLDADGNAVENTPVTVATADVGPYRAEIGGEVRWLSSTAMALTTDSAGRISLFLPASGIAAPELVLRAGLIEQRVTPAHDNHVYLSGRGTLHPTNPGGALPEFTEDGTILQPLDPQVPPQTRARVAQAVRGLAQLAVDGPAPGVDGFRLTLTQEALLGQNPLFMPLSADALAAESNMPAGDSAPLTDWEELWRLLQQGSAIARQVYTDLSESITASVTKVTDVIVSFSDKVITFSLEGFATAVKMLWRGVQDLTDLIVCTVERIGEEAGKKFADLLTAAFDMEAIWRTQAALDAAFREGFQGAKENLHLIAEHIDEWSDEQLEQLAQTFASADTALQQEGLDEATLAEVGRHGTSEQDRLSVTAAQRNPHGNWLENKFADALPQMELEAPTALADLESLLGELVAEIEELTAEDLDGDDFIETMEALGEQLLTDLDLETPAQIGMPSFMPAVQRVLATALKVSASVAKAVVTFTIRLLDSFLALWDSTPAFGLSGVLVPSVWRGLASRGGGGKELTVGGLTMLLAAFPVTAVTKLLLGREPFPPAGAPASQNPDTPMDTPIVPGIVAGILATTQVLPTTLGDIRQLAVTHSLIAGVMCWGFGTTAVSLRMVAHDYTWSGIFEDYLTAAEFIFGFLASMAAGSRFLTVPPASWGLAGMEGIIGLMRSVIEIIKIATGQEMDRFRALADIFIALPGTCSLATIGNNPYGIAAKAIANAFGFPVGGIMIAISYLKPGNLYQPGTALTG
ncbi:discoidin domain-containing protein [Streptomyces olivoreticuli]|uniref:discoidin domain-containing protein n=1 Tax=Streptomyces olivoreticuli TaxID=68246 RepID=UPI002659D9D0|nr:discoidin domain-containing protein [Streptomyces olivoreticuli]WKK24189.1 discoidin domain-containing protein [Streptomyces olivoreticuli]